MRARKLRVRAHDAQRRLFRREQRALKLRNLVAARQEQARRIQFRVAQLRQKTQTEHFDLSIFCKVGSWQVWFEFGSRSKKFRVDFWFDF